jgi:general secretion pathway protein C
MQTNPQSKWGLRLATLCVWALAAASVVYWGLLIRSPAGGAVAAMVPPVSAASADPAKIARLLGAVDGPTATVPVASVASRFALIGVVAGASGAGAALIAVDGKPARSFRVGTAVDTGYVLKTVGPRIAVLATTLDAPPAFTLEMAPASRSLNGPGVPPVRFTPPPQAIPAPAATPNFPGMQPPGVPPATQPPGMQSPGVPFVPPGTAPRAEGSKRNGSAFGVPSGGNVELAGGRRVTAQ